MFIILVTITTLFTIIQGIPPKIVKHSRNYFLIKPGESVDLNCQSDIKPYTVTWLKDGKSLDTSLAHFETNSNNLKIFNVQRSEEYEGKYRCKITNSAGESTILDQDITIAVQYLDEKFIFKPFDASFYGIFKGNNDSTLAWGNCALPKGSPPPQQKWINGSSGVEINKDDPRVRFLTFVINGNIYHQFRIYNATLSDTGVWSCQAKNAIEERNAFFNVTMYEAPKSVQNVSVKIFYINKFVVQWNFLRNDIKYYDIILNNTNTMVTRTEQLEEHFSPLFFKTEFEFDGIKHGEQYSLSIRATDKNDQVGKWSAPKIIDVPKNVPPYIVNDMPEFENVGKGKSHMIYCKAVGIPKPTFAWYRNGKEIIENSRYDMSDNVLLMKNVLPGEDHNDAYYNCRAINVAGTIESKKTRLRVEWIDDAFISPPNSRLFYKSTTFLRIPSLPPNGFPKPAIRYKINGVTITTLTHPLFGQGFFTSVSNVQTNTLDIRTPNILVEGAYEMIAENLGGRRVAKFFITLADAPKKITHFVARYLFGHVIVEWYPSKSVAKISRMGSNFEYRFDIKTFVIEYQKSGESTSNAISTSGKLLEGVTLEYVFDNLLSGIEYKLRIKSVDSGGQESLWSDWITVKLELNLPPYINNAFAKDVYTLPNKNLTLPCSSSSKSPATLEWYKDNKLIADNGIFDIEGKNLNLYNTNHETHDGSYYCKATDAEYGSTTSRTAKVMVYYIKEKFQFTESTITVYDIPKFRQIRVLCIPPESQPDANIYWSNGTEKFIQFSDEIIKNDEDIIDGVSYFSLTFKNAVKYVGTEVGCAAYNRFIGFNSEYKLALTKIVLNGPPSWTSALNLTSLSSSSSKVSWVKERDDIVKWEVTLKEEDLVLDTRTVTNATNTVFENLSPNLQYTFQVVMVDKAGQKSAVKTVYTSSSPPVVVIDLSTPSTLPTEGSNASLTCEFNGYPFPRIEWFKDGYKFVPSNEPNYALTNDNQTLLMLNITHEMHDGKYQCKASNNEGSASTKMIEFRVSYFNHKFAIADPDKQFYDSEGERLVTFHCSPPTSYPFFVRNGANVIWIKDDTTIQGDMYKMSTGNKDGLLIDMLEFNATSSSVGIYKCIYVLSGIFREHQIKLSLFDGPLRPQNFALKQKSWNFAILQWTPPGEAIDKYEMAVQLLDSKYNDTDRIIEIDASATNLKVSQLRASFMYSFTIVAVKNTSRSMETTNKVQLLSQPDIGITGPPHDIQTLSIGISDATLKWKPPVELSNNLPSELKYVIDVCIASCVLYVTALSEYKLVNLTEETSYTFSISAINELNVQGPSKGDTFTTLTNGIPPTVLNFAIFSHSWNYIIVQWDDPEKKRKIQNYQLTIHSGNTPKTFIIEKDLTKYQFTQLEELTSYNMSITAVNELHKGTTVSIVADTVAISNVGAVTDVTTQPSVGYETERFVLNWKKPENIGNNLPEDISYKLEICNGEVCQTHNFGFERNNYLVQDLLADTTYAFTFTTIKADNTSGEMYTKQYKTAAENRKPSTPKSVQAVKGANQEQVIQLSWQQPDDLAGNDPINTQYLIVYCEKTDVVGDSCNQTIANETSVSIENLKFDTEYEIKISALSFRNETGATQVVYLKTDALPTIPPTTTTTTTKKPGTKSEQSDDSLSTGVLVAIIVAVLVVIILVVAVVVVCLKSRKRKGHVI